MLLLLISIFFAGGAVASCSSLSCFLSHAVLHLPDETVEDVIHLKEITCANFSVATFVSEPPLETSVEVGIRDAQLGCHMKWSAILGLEHGEIWVSASHFNVSAALMLPAPFEARVGRCHAALDADISAFQGKSGIDKKLHAKVVQIIEEKVPTTLCTLLKKEAAGTVTDALHELQQLLEASPPQHHSPPPAPPGTVDLQHSGVISMLDFIVSSLIGADGLNSVLRHALNSTGGTLAVPVNAHFATSNVSLAVDQLDIGPDLAAFTDISALKPIDPYELEVLASGSGPVQVNVTFHYNVSVGHATFDAYGQLYMSVNNSLLNTSTALFARSSRFDNVSWDEMITPSCLLSGLSAVNITQLELSTSLLELGVRTLTNESITAAGDVLLDRVLQLLLKQYRVYVPNVLRAFLAEPGRRKINHILDRILHNSSPANCQMREFNTPSAVNYTVFVVACSVMTMLAVLIVILMCVCRDHAPPSSLAFSPRIPTVIRMGVPLLMCLLWISMITSNATTSAYLIAKMIFGDEREVVSPALYQISLSSSIRSALNAGVYQMALTLIVFTAMWPHAKLFAQMLLWFVPKFKHRENLFMLIDWLGKFQLINAFVQVIFSIAFRFSVESLRAPASSFDLYVVTSISYTLYFLNALLGMLLNHFQLWMCRYETGTFVLPDRGPFVREEHATSFRGWLAGLGLLLTTALLLAGTFLESFQIEFLGLGARALALLHVQDVRPFSLWTLGLQLRTAWMDPQSSRAFALQSFYFLTTMVMPLCLIIILAILWVAPLKRTARLFLYRAAEFFILWTCAEVFFLAVMACISSLFLQGRFMVGHHCDGINRFIRKYFSGELSDPRCIDINSSILPGTYVLAAGAVLLMAVSRYILLKNYRTLVQDTNDLGYAAVVN